jgi:hypothetical protein
MTLSAFHEGRSREQLQLPQDDTKEDIKDDHDDTINKIASDLLEDTVVEQRKEDPGRNLIKFGFAGTKSEMSITPTVDGPNDDSKELPQIPLNLFNDDNPWAMKNSPAVTSASHLNTMRFSADELSTGTGSISRNAFSHTRKSSAPAIPRRSSKRKSGRSKSNITSPQKPTNGHIRGTASKNKLSKSFSTPMIMNVSAPVNQSIATTSSVNPQDISGKIAKMLEATQALKGSSSESAIQQGPSIPSKKQRLKDNKVLAKVKTAINDRMTSRNGRRTHDPIRDDRLLNLSIYDSPEIDIREPIGNPTKAEEIRLREGRLFETLFLPFVLLTCYRRKPQKIENKLHDWKWKYQTKTNKER